MDERLGLRHAVERRHTGGMAESWRTLSPPTRAALAALGVVEAGLLLAAQVDISRRSPAQVRGRKIVWRLVSLINIVGPIAYFTRGRR